MTPVRASVITGPRPWKTSSDEGGEAGDGPGSCFLVTGAGPLRLGQDLTCSAVRAGVALLLPHRDHEPSCEASDDGSETSLAAGDCCQADGQGASPPRGQLWNVRPYMDCNGRSWTMCPLLRI
jgi:hypothetical protein